MPVELRHIENQVKSIAKDIMGVFADGKVTAGEAIAVLPSVAHDVMVMVGRLEGMTGAERMALATAAVRNVYDQLDPDIPYVPAFIENPMEEWVLDHLVPPLIQRMFDLLPEKFRGE